MILDASAVFAILNGELEAVAFSEAIEGASAVRFSAGSYLEACVVIARVRNPKLTVRLDEILEDAEVKIEPFTEEQARVASQAYRDYGKGSGHPAGLNFGDCFSYALARVTREPLLFKGDDFIHTDIRPAVYTS